MQTILDQSRTWFLHCLYYDQEELKIILIEGIISKEPEDVVIYNDVVLRNSFAIEILPSSKLMLIRFSQYVAWQVIDESFTVFDPNEQRDDDGFIQIISQSKYLDYINTNHGWYEQIIGVGKHYRIWTENEIIDVITCEQPIIEPFTKP